MACKSLDPVYEDYKNLKAALIESYKNFIKSGRSAIKIKELLDGTSISDEQVQFQLNFSADEILDETISSEEELELKCSKIEKRFRNARDSALQNTKNYLSMVNELDMLAWADELKLHIITNECAPGTTSAQGTDSTACSSVSRASCQGQSHYSRHCNCR